MCAYISWVMWFGSGWASQYTSCVTRRSFLVRLVCSLSNGENRCGIIRSSETPRAYADGLARFDEAERGKAHFTPGLNAATASNRRSSHRHDSSGTSKTKRGVCSDSV